MIAVDGSVMHRSRSGLVFEIRPCGSLEELDACLALQRETWGSPDLEMVPRNLFVLAQALGGHVLCAWDQRGSLAGYAMAIAAHEPVSEQGLGSWMRPVDAAMPSDERAAAPEPYLHSHQVAVAAKYQGEGLGFALKLAQREQALARGLRMMRWTFDPMMARNAYFNLHRLGAVVRRYVPNFYGLLGSRLQGGLPTDRLLAEWPLESERVQRAVDRRAQEQSAVAARVELPPAIAAAKAAGDREQALTLQTALRAELQHALRSGLEIHDFHPSGVGGAYLLRRCDHPLAQIHAD